MWQSLCLLWSEHDWAGGWILGWQQGHHTHVASFLSVCHAPALWPLLAWPIPSLWRMGGGSCVCPSFLTMELAMLCKGTGQRLGTADSGWIQPRDLDAVGLVFHYCILQSSHHPALVTGDVQGWSAVWGCLVWDLCLQQTLGCPGYRLGADGLFFPCSLQCWCGFSLMLVPCSMVWRYWSWVSVWLVLHTWHTRWPWESSGGWSTLGGWSCSLKMLHF